RAAQQGETCVIYHTGDDRQAVGLATVERTAYPDPKKNDDKLIVIDVRAGARLPTPVRLEQIKADPRFADSPLVRMGRLSVVAISAFSWSSESAHTGVQGLTRSRNRISDLNTLPMPAMIRWSSSASPISTSECVRKRAKASSRGKWSARRSGPSETMAGECRQPDLPSGRPPAR